MVGPIELTPAEQDLASKIIFDVLNHPMEDDEWQENGERASALMQRLMEREAIPEPRRRYFTDPEYNPNRGKESRFTYFKRNAGSADKVLRHPHFLPYLHYFIYGADLPPALKHEFEQKASDYWIKGSDLAKFAQHLVRKYNIERHPTNYRLKDDFYQLALDAGCDEETARRVRDAATKVKK